MKCLSLFTASLFVGLAASSFPAVGLAEAVESGVAITNPEVAAHLDGTFYSAGALLFPGRHDARTLRNDNLLTGKMSAVGRVLKKDIEELPQQSADPTAREYFKNGEHQDRRFSARLLDDKHSGFVLTGVINRMDRAYRTVDGAPRLTTCGEIRFIYRFTYDVKVGSTTVASRLPLTMAIVMNARDADTTIGCAESAKRWIRLGALSSVQEQIEYLDADDGPLKYLQPSQVDRIEANIQLFRIPAGAKNDFGSHAEYLLRVFRWSAPNAAFLPTFLENQVDRELLLAKPKKLAEFRKWVLGADAIRDLDRGTLDIPWPFLANRAISVSPGASSRSANQPFFGLLSDDDIRDALQKAEAGGQLLRNLKSVNGFNRMINDLSCTGCHQTRAIAGFHFPGADPESEAASNAVHVPGSAHFLSDLPRRRAVVEAFASGSPPDFRRYFSARPDPRYKAALAATEIADGWGATCYSGADESFQDWQCRSGLSCRGLAESSRNLGMGTCVTEGKVAIGDPLEFGVVSHAAYGADEYMRTEPPGPSKPNNYELPKTPSDRKDYVAAHQGYRAEDLTGGFPAGMLRIAGCKDLPAEASCGRVARTGFNACIAGGRPWSLCVEKCTEPAGLRACDINRPCREDYICTAPHKNLGATTAGTCIPPYFLFQFRADGHPTTFSEGDYSSEAAVDAEKKCWE
jgi:hypothetical protein